MLKKGERIARGRRKIYSTAATKPEPGTIPH